jgi:hypothetical protein
VFQPASGVWVRFGWSSKNSTQLQGPDVDDHVWDCLLALEANITKFEVTLLQAHRIVWRGFINVAVMIIVWTFQGWGTTH